MNRLSVVMWDLECEGREPRDTNVPILLMDKLRLGSGNRPAEGDSELIRTATRSSWLDPVDPR